MSFSPPVTPTPINDLISRYEKRLIAIPDRSNELLLIAEKRLGIPVGNLKK